MNRVIKQTIRGCGKLPYVGHHPGTAVAIGLTLVTGVAGASSGGFIGFALGFALGALFYGPTYLYGAYYRARLSDNLSKAEARPRG